MTNEVKKVPELRFPEFGGEWEEKKLGDIGSVAMNKRIYKNETTHHGEIPFYKIGTFGKKAETFISREKFEEYKEKYPYPNKGDILISASGSIGRTVEYDGEEAYYQDSNIVWLQHNNEVLNVFLKYFYLIVKWNGIEGTTIKRLYNKNILNTKIELPVKEEQQKIGEFFSKLDRQIELEEQKLEKLEEQKKGYMQQIFSQQLRFKDENGNDYPGWKEYVLGETGNTYSGLSSKTKEDFGYGDSYFITYMNVFKNTIAKANMTEKVNIQENEKQNKVNYKDILFTTSSEVPEETGMSSIWLYKENNVYLNSFCFGFHVTCDDIEPIYLTRFLRSEKMRKQITILSQGSTRFNISKKEVMKLKIDVPNLEEQTKIVNFLSEYDSLIENQSSKIELLKERKQGFLQKMFV